MLIDFLYAVLLVLALVKGYQRGLVVGLFSLVAVFIGIAAAMKLSAVVAGYIGSTVKVSNEWLPFVAFLVVFLGVILLVRLGANAIEKTIEVAMLGWVNRLGGMLLYVALYTLVFSVLLFYAVQMNFISPETLQRSVTYSHIQPWGPKAIDGFGSVIPLFKDMFAELETFFEKVAGNIPPAGTH